MDDVFLILILYVFLPSFDVFASIEFALLIELVKWVIKVQENASPPTFRATFLPLGLTFAGTTCHSRDLSPTSGRPAGRCFCSAPLVSQAWISLGKVEMFLRTRGSAGNQVSSSLERESCQQVLTRTQYVGCPQVG